MESREKEWLVFIWEVDALLDFERESNRVKRRVATVYMS